MTITIAVVVVAAVAAAATSLKVLDGLEDFIVCAKGL
jgi:hypothetical protein